MNAAVSASPDAPSDPAPSRGSAWVCSDPRSAPDLAQARALASEGVTSADVTLFGPSAEIHAFHTRDRASFAAQLRGARALVQAGVSVGLTIPVTRANVRHLAELVDVAASVGATSVRFERAASADAPNPSVVADQLDVARRRAARLRIRANCDVDAVSTARSRAPHSPELRPLTRPGSTAPSQTQR